MKSSKVSTITCDKFSLMIMLKNDKGNFHLETMENILWSYHYEGYENIDKLNLIFTKTFVKNLKKTSSKQYATQL
jgi:hypothetical protein